MASNKKTADHTGQDITALPSSIASDTQALVLAENKNLTSLEGVGNLKSLETLDANGCGLTTVPAEIEGCAALAVRASARAKRGPLSKLARARTTATEIN